jgi:hypothetical protein
VLSVLFIREVNKTYCKKIGMKRKKRVSFFYFRIMIDIQKSWEAGLLLSDWQLGLKIRGINPWND